MVKRSAGVLLPWRRRVELALTRRFAPVGRWLAQPARLKRLGRLPFPVSRSVRPPLGPWRGGELNVPVDLAGHPGISKSPQAELEAFRERPLPNFHRLHHKAMEWALVQMWRSMLPSMPRFLRAHRVVAQILDHAAPSMPAADDPAELTRGLREYAEQIGLSSVGIAAQDEKYVFAEYQQTVADGDRVLVAVLEQNWEATQTAPSSRAERAAFATYAELLEMSARLAAFLVDRGYRAHVHASEGEGMAINYAVEAGLGQLGLNGQLLTPTAGSRARLKLITTDAPLNVDGPQDYGIEKLCDACHGCVQRCPSGAITAVRREHRGVFKAKINTARCLPVVAQADGCAVCMKVCPVQRYGLPRVMEHWERTGTVLGRGTDELEQYDWIDGRRYASGERPAIEQAFFNPPEMDFDASRAPDAQAPGGIFADGGANS